MLQTIEATRTCKMVMFIPLAAIFFIAAAPVFAEEYCSYMTEIPRGEKPDEPLEIDEDVPWGERPLLPGPERPFDDVCMNQYQPSASPTTMGSQVILMEEEIEGNVIIARLNYDGPNEPQIDRNFLSGSSALLGAVINKTEDGLWHLVITQKQDYEAPGMQLYVFYISVEDEPLTVATAVQIVNIDDNRPMIQAFEACQLVELGEPGLTECVYEVSDLDGRISTEFMTFNITSDRNDDQIFYIMGSNLENEWMRMHMTVGLRTPLDFDQNALHIFDVTAYDSLPNNHTVPLMVQVVSLERRPPRWLEIFAVQQFDEKTNQSFPVRAIDGDIQFNRPIYYRIETAPDDYFFRIEATDGGGATFYVDPIDRDTLERDVFQLSIIAYKLNDHGEEMISTTAPVVIIINDVNDNAPIPFHDEYSIDIREETAMTLDLEDFGFHDRDLGQNAQYTVRLQSVWPPGVHEAFTINPSVGYQRQTFIIGTVNHTMLDFEETEFQNITLLVVATDMNRTDLVGNATLYVNLMNWNDELPIFEHESLTATFNETEGEGFFVGNLRAKDRDIGDRVEHSLMGNVADFLTIDKNTGDIYVSANDSFDYHRQNLIFVQVRADDTFMAPFHTAVSQLLIQLLDINNTPPILRLPRGTFSTDENVPVGHLITDEITATDPDTTARLEFEIHWESSYATKQGRAADASEYHNCVEIIPLTDEGHPGSVRARIEVREVRPGITIDFEMFEVLYLTIRVYDRETYIGDDYDESTFTINIVDLNDNPPVWDEGTLEQAFSVRELSASGVVIGSVLATDIDGPLYNQVRYTIAPHNNTPPGLVTIHFYTGQITVETARAIDADVPPRWLLNYTVVASDCCYAEDKADCPPDPHCHDTEGEITINIIDTNNKVPQPDFENELFNTTVYLLENATNLEFVTYIVANDLDRDELYHTVAYQINYAVNPLLLQLFAIDLYTGELYVNYPEGSTTVLDRDGDHPTHQIFFNLFDNFLGEGDGTRNQNEVNITVILLDVNDNAPELPDPSQIAWSISENYSEGTSFLPIIHAPDRDEPNTPNSLVGFEIGTLHATDRDLDVPVLVNIRSIDTDRGELFTAVDLRGYWGTYDMPIRAFDHGHPQQESDEVYQLVIRPWNYHDPVFVFPVQDSVIRLSREQALATSFLQTTDGSFLDRVHATDEDGGTAGEVSFAVIGDEEAVAFFDVSNDIGNYGTLTLRRNDITDMIKEFQVTIEATDAGTEPGVRRSQSTFTAVFVPISGDPIFEVNTATVAFIELEEGLAESFPLPSAIDFKNHRCDDDCHDIFYRITDGNTEGHFGLDAENNTIYLVRELDRSVSAVHTLTVAASNLRAPSTPPTAGSTLTVTVNVREADPRPRFLRQIYTAGISVGDTINREVLTVQAAHTDGLPITYTIDPASMVVDPTLEAVKDLAFTLHPDTGVLTLNIQPTSSMHGMFEFHVVASDPAGGQDTANVRVYLITSLNRVIFTFVNTLTTIEANVDFIAQTFSAGFQMTCNIDQVLPATDSLGIGSANLTEVRSHFIRSDTPVPAEEIELLRSDTVLLRGIQTTLNTELLVLDDFFTDLSPEGSGAEAALVTIYVLAALAGLLGFLCLLLLVTFIIRTRILNRRLEALSMTKYGSVDSGLNRAGLAAPGTNKHAVEGSNPIWNEVIKAPDFDTLSDVSDDSDLIGIEDLPQFRNDYFPPGDVNSTSDILPFEEPVATHENNFGFNATPFSPDFANRQFQRN